MGKWYAPKSPLCKGRCHGSAVTEGLSVDVKHKSSCRRTIPCIVKARKRLHKRCILKKDCGLVQSLTIERSNRLTEATATAFYEKVNELDNTRCLIEYKVTE